MSPAAFQSFPDDARLWLFAFPRPLTEAEQATVAQGFQAFQPHWKTHGTLIDSAWALLEGQILAVTERTMGTSPSGCSIDAMLRHALKVAATLDLPLLDAQQVLVRDGGQLRVIPKTELTAVLGRGELHAHTPVVDLGLLELGQLRGGKLERPLAATWIGRKHRDLLDAPAAR